MAPNIEVELHLASISEENCTMFPTIGPCMNELITYEYKDNGPKRRN